MYNIWEQFNEFNVLILPVPIIDIPIVHMDGMHDCKQLCRRVSSDEFRLCVIILALQPTTKFIAHNFLKLAPKNDQFIPLQRDGAAFACGLSKLVAGYLRQAGACYLGLTLIRGVLGDNTAGGSF